MVESSVRYRDLARHNQSITARGDTQGKAETLVTAKAKLVVGVRKSAKSSLDMTTPPPMHAASGSYSNAVFTFTDSATNPALPVTKNVEVRDVSTAYLNPSTADDSIDITDPDVDAFASAWIAAEAGNANFVLTSARFLNN